MKDDDLNRAIAESLGWESIQAVDYGSVETVWYNPVTKQQDDFPNYLDEKNPGPAHELIEVLRGEGWSWTFQDSKVGWSVTFWKNGSSRHAQAPTFCRAVSECFARVRGIYKE